MSRVNGEDNNGSTELSIIIPAYNEESRLPITLDSVIEYCDSRGVNYEIIVVDDGSTDGTSKVVRSYEARSPQVKLLLCPGNRGKGFAVRLGILNSQGERALFNDADGATPIEELARLSTALDDGADVAIGSRAMFSEETLVSTVWYRKFLGRIFSGFVNWVILPGIKDTQCGFKLFTRKAAHYVFSQQRADRFAFDVEILFLARKAGCIIAEVPINWTNIPGSKVNLVKDSLAMGFDILRFRLRSLLGQYEIDPSFRS